MTNESPSSKREVLSDLHSVRRNAVHPFDREAAKRAIRFVEALPDEPSAPTSNERSIYEHDPGLETLPQIKARDARDYPKLYTNPWAQCAMDDRHWLLAELERLQELLQMASRETNRLAHKASDEPSAPSSNSLVETLLESFKLAHRHPFSVELNQAFLDARMAVLARMRADEPEQSPCPNCGRPARVLRTDDGVTRCWHCVEAEHLALEPPASNERLAELIAYYSAAPVRAFDQETAAALRELQQRRAADEPKASQARVWTRDGMALATETEIRCRTELLYYTRPAVPPTVTEAVGVIYDRLGWVCSVCHGWNHVRDKHCTHTHAVTKNDRCQCGAQLPPLAQWSMPSCPLCVEKAEAADETKGVATKRVSLGKVLGIDDTPVGWCPICGGQDGAHKSGCEDGSEVL